MLLFQNLFIIYKFVSTNRNLILKAIPDSFERTKTMFFYTLFSSPLGNYVPFLILW
jgi:hypothetical protein